MKRLALVLFLVAAFLPAYSQEFPTGAADSPRTQIAFRLFSTWAENYQRDAEAGKAIATSVLYGSGSVALVGAVVTHFAGDQISQSIAGKALDPEIKQNLSLGLGIAGASLYIAGFIVSQVKSQDYRKIYADVFDESDPDVQEAMAVSVLRYQADRGKERRITSFISALAVPLITGGIKAGINMARGDPWSDGVFDTMKGQAWSIASGLVSLFTKTSEERLYDRYVTTREALYGIPDSRTPFDALGRDR